MKLTGFILLFAASVFAQAPNPVQTGVTPNPNGTEPIFRVDVTSRTISAVNYHNRQGTTKIDFRGTALMPEAREKQMLRPIRARRVFPFTSIVCLIRHSSARSI